MNNEIITSRQNPGVKAVCALEDKKGRKKAGLFKFDGVKLFAEALGRAEICRIFVRHPESDTVKESIGRAVDEGYLSEDRIFYVSETVFEKLTEENSPEGIVTVARFLEGLHKEWNGSDILELSCKRLLITESVRDPGNLGTVMRSCAALGIDTLIISHDCADIYNAKTVRSAMGAIFKMPTLTVNREELPRFIGELQKNGRKVYAAALRNDAEKIGELGLRSCDCFVIGNEGHGLSESVIEACDGTAIIPMVEGNESLNASAAAAICIWETVRAPKN